MEESFKQGDSEKKLKIDINPLGDRDNVSIEKCQVNILCILHVHDAIIKIIIIKTLHVP